MTVGEGYLEEKYEIIIDGFSSNEKGDQERLRNLGYYDGVIDGKFGKIAELGIETFQSDFKLEVSGRIEDEFRSKMRSLIKE